MSPELASLVGGISTALISAGPAYLAFRRARGAERSAQAAEEAVGAEGTHTRYEISREMGHVLARLEGRIDGVNANINDIRAWQVGHTAEHIAITSQGE